MWEVLDKGTRIGSGLSAPIRFFYPEAQAFWCCRIFQFFKKGQKSRLSCETFSLSNLGKCSRHLA